ncbi:uncharacterized protein TNCV_703301 [Trichonephila clavipes]|nr:uncharacterized protein TNCV_703301 [Trichonephila clavipes]
MPLRRLRRQYEQLSKRASIIGMMEAGWSARRVARQSGCYDEKWYWDRTRDQASHDPIPIPLGYRGHVTYTKTRLRTPSTDQSSRRPPHLKKCTRRANCFIGHHPGTGIAATITCAAFDAPLEWFHAQGNWTAAERNQVVFSDESRLNLGSDDNRIRVWRPRGERLNPALLYSDTPLPQLV